MKRLRLPLAILALAIALTVAVGFASGRTDRTANATSATSSASALQDTFISVFKKVSPSVVQIQTSEGLGSGIVFDSKGDIVTNNHVVSGATTVTVTTSTGKTFKGAKVVGTFEEDDLAVVKVNGLGLRPATFADSSALKVGDITMAIGNPLGLQSSFTEGIVSALGRDQSEGNGGPTIQNTIQTSAAINPGNSGGALVDIQGDVIGIPTLAASDQQLGGAAVGIGFALPSNDVKNYAQQIIAHGKVVNSDRAYLGIEAGDTGAGVYVESVQPGSPAATAGLAVGDVITAIGGTPTPTFEDLGTVLANLKPGQTVAVKFTRQAGTSSTVNIKLGEFPATTAG
jgi:S1-C subfamily serine protease